MKHFLSEEECDYLISAAKTEGLINSATEKNSDNRDPRNFVLMDVNEDKQLSIEEVSCFLPNEFTYSYKHTKLLYGLVTPYKVCSYHAQIQRGWGKPQKYGVSSNTGPEPLKITKLSSQYSILGHHLHASEMALIACL